MEVAEGGREREAKELESEGVREQEKREKRESGGLM